MRWLLALVLVACGSKSDPGASVSGSTKPEPPRDAGPPPPQIPTPGFEAQPPRDPIVDLADDCVTRKSGRVDCWTETVQRAEVTDATVWRDDGVVHCWIAAGAVTCKPDHDARPPKFDGVTDAVDVRLGAPTCVLHKTGKVTCWDPAKSAAEPAANLRDATALLANPVMACAVRKTGQVSCTELISSTLRWRGVTGIEHVRVLAIAQGGAENGDFFTHACAIHDDGALRCYDFDGHEEGPIRARPPGDDEAHPPPPEPFRNATALAFPRLGGLTGLVGGKVVVFDGKTARTLPQLDDAVAITDHCALRKQGSVVCWGDHNLGQPRRDKAATPVPVAGGGDVVSLATGSASGWAVTTDGRALRWGDKKTGWAVPFPAITNVTAVVHDDGPLEGPPCFLRKDTGVTCLGYAVPDQPIDLKLGNVVALRAGMSAYLAVRGDGTVVRWLPYAIDNPNRTLTPIANLANAVEAAGDFNLLCARDAAGTVQCATQTCRKDATNKDQCVDGPVTAPGVTDAVELAVRRGAACARTKSGTITCWGDNALGYLGRPPGAPDPRPQPVPGLTSTTALAASEGGFCAALADGSLTCWGQHDTPAPRRVLPPGSVGPRFAGATNGCTIRPDGVAACWGDNQGGRLGDGSVVHLDAPAAVPGL